MIAMDELTSHIVEAIEWSFKNDEPGEVAFDGTASEFHAVMESLAYDYHAIHSGVLHVWSTRWDAETMMPTWSLIVDFR